LDWESLHDNEYKILVLVPASLLAGGLMGSGANARVAGDDEEMQRFVPIEDLFKGRHFDRQIIVCA
jgi:hypothetical protein